MTATLLTEEQLLLTKHEARQILKAKGRTVLQVVRCNIDSILYLGASHRPMTAWLWRDGHTLEIQYENGWPASPGHDLRPETPDRHRLEPHHFDEEYDQA